ncbi:hypothetical protein ABEB36_014530 [Hypothenemus hampei]|uniref:MADF domain-containing protein n=1 Tax=Hypothenemus hampei TaxID=57062 RepID=A0ABD1E2Y7_HYPHA
MDEEKKKKVFSWNKETLTTFFHVFESYPCLYDPKNKFYSNKHSRAEALNNIKRDMDISQISIEDIKSKINNVRTQISQELKKIKKTPRSGAGSEEVYEPIWWYDLAQFLVPFIKPRPGKDNIENVMEVKKSLPETIEDDSISMTSSESLEGVLTPITSSETSVQRNKRKRTSTEGDSGKTLEKTIETIQVLNDNIVKAAKFCNEGKEIEFGQYVAKEQSEIDDGQILIDIKYKICKVIHGFKRKWINNQNRLEFEFLN